jgi:hypothetical protein
MTCFDAGGPGIELVEYLRFIACHFEIKRSALETTTATSRKQHPAAAASSDVSCNMLTASLRF